MNKKFYLTASIKLDEATDELRKEVASVINLPAEGDKQPDLSYFSAILVSTGTNLNNACFLGSELVAAAGTIVSKALDVEHAEQEVIGHIYSSAFTDSKHEPLDLTELASVETASLDAKDMHIQIGCVVYKNRFPELAKEIAAQDYKVSMECYYKDFDIKIGDTIIPRAAAEAVGLETTNESIYGQKAKVVKNGLEIANGDVARVLRGICFSGVGIVKNPANPDSIIIETASIEAAEPKLEIVIESKEAANTPEPPEVNNVTSKEVGDESNLTMDESDQLIHLEQLEFSTASYVEALYTKKRLVSETDSKIKRLRLALDKANKLI